MSWRQVVTTPNILTEVNSLANQLGEPERSQCMELFAKTITQLEEQYQSSEKLSALPEFKKFGLTDCGILNLSQTPYLILTDDFRLSAYLQKQGVDAVNFTNLRPILQR